MSTLPYVYKETLLLIDHVSLAYGDKQILRDVDAEIKNIHRDGCQQGQVVALLGPSGIGKTQLLRIIAGLQKPTKGAVGVPTADPTHMQEVERGQVGVVYQNYPLFNHRTVLGNLAIVGQSAERTLAMVERFQLDGVLNQYPAQLSGGQRQRVAIAQQILCSDHLLLMDEPFSGLDQVMEEEVIKLIQEISTADELNTVIVVTHDITAACSVADHLWLLGRDPRPKNDVTKSAPPFLPGARIVEIYDLIERDLCWHPNLVLEPKFSDFVREVKSRFRTL